MLWSCPIPPLPRCPPAVRGASAPEVPLLVVLEQGAEVPPWFSRGPVLGGDGLTHSWRQRARAADQGSAESAPQLGCRPETDTGLAPQWPRRPGHMPLLGTEAGADGERQPLPAAAPQLCCCTSERTRVPGQARPPVRPAVLWGWCANARLQARRAGQMLVPLSFALTEGRQRTDLAENRSISFSLNLLYAYINITES